MDFSIQESFITVEKGRELAGDGLPMRRVLPPSQLCLVHMMIGTNVSASSLAANFCIRSLVRTLIGQVLSTSDVGAGADADAPASVVGAGAGADAGAGVDTVGAVDVGDVDSNTKDVVALVVQATLPIDSFFHNAASLGITVE